MGWRLRPEAPTGLPGLHARLPVRLAGHAPE